MNVFLVRTSSSLDHEGSPDVYGVYTEKHLAHEAILHEWPNAKVSKHDPECYDITKYNDAYVEEWSVIAAASEFKKVY